MMLQKIQERFLERAVLFGSQFLLHPKDALEYLTACKSYAFRLEGVEGFLVTENGAYQPSQEDSNDFNDVNCSHGEFVNMTRTFIEERSKKNVLFEVVFSEH
ncbi:hypothetical protein [Reinekea sp.]|uniref:hypothetical protein n=1 Tax=Reinekea sp. TaxID=1970455 RepID=UPI003989FF50